MDTRQINKTVEPNLYITWLISSADVSLYLAMFSDMHRYGNLKTAIHYVIIIQFPVKFSALMST